MAAVQMLARVRLRCRWGATIALVLLVALAGTAVLASVAGARRSASALGRFEADSRAATFEIDAGDPTDAQLRRFLRTPGIEGVGRLRQIALFNPDLGFLPVAGPMDGSFAHAVDRPRVVAGRAARAVDELEIGEGLAESLGLGVGDRLRFGSFTQAQIDSGELEGGDFTTKGPDVEFRIVGIVRRPLDLGARGAAGGVLVPTGAFVDRHRDEIGSFSGMILRVRTANGAADAPRINAAARASFGGSEQFSIQPVGIEGSGAQSAIDVVSTALWVLAGVIAFTGLVAVGMALARLMADDAAEQDSLRALGMRRSQRWTATFVRALPIAVGGAVLAAGGAFAASPLFPIGVAREAEPDPGLRADPLVLLGGAAVVAAVVLGLGAVAAWSVVRRRDAREVRATWTTRATTAAVLPPAVTVGVGFAFERGRGRRAVPVWSTTGAIALGIVGVVGAMAFATSLHHLTTTPAAYGWTWDLAAFGVDHRDAPCSPTSEITSERGVGAVASLCYRSASVGGRVANVWAFQPVQGSIGPTIVTGRTPVRAGEVAVGRALLAASGRRVGDRLVVATDDGRHRMRIVGITVMPSLDDPQPLAGSVVVTPAGMERLGGAFDSYTVLTVRPGADGSAVAAQVGARAAEPASAAALPAEIDRLVQIDGVPVALAVLMAVVGLAAVGFTLVVSVHRRGHDLAILKTLGFDRRQVRAAVAWQATSLTLAGLAVGLLIGLVVGRWVWHAVATGLGVAPTTHVPVVGLGIVVVAALVLTNAVAWFPARRAASTPPAVVLRSE